MRHALFVTVFMVMILTGFSFVLAYSQNPETGSSDSPFFDEDRGSAGFGFISPIEDRGAFEDICISAVSSAFSTGNERGEVELEENSLDNAEKEIEDGPICVWKCPEKTGTCTPGHHACTEYPLKNAACEWTCTNAGTWGPPTKCATGWCHGNQCM